MLKTNKKFNRPLIGIFTLIGGFFLFQYLTFIPEYSSAEEISTTTPATITPTTPLAKWKDLEYMQQMTPQACEDGDETGKQLIDSRDGNKYWVGKLWDGRCWMTQNLDLNLDKNTPLTPDDSDVEQEWYPTSTIIDSISNWDTSNTNAIQSFDPGYYVYTTPSKRTFCTISPSMDYQCLNLGWVEINKDDTTHNKHYSIGNYYSWNAVTAGTGQNITENGTNATHSICPKGWTLPTSNTSYVGTLNTLLSSFGFSNKLNSPLVSSYEIDIRLDPMYFFYAGMINSANQATNVGGNGYYWTAGSTGTTSALRLHTADNIWPGGNGLTGMRNWGLSARCIAKDTSSVIPIDPSIPAGSGINDPNISVSIPSIITLDVSDSVDITTKSNEVNTGTFTAKVTSNQDYSISLNAAGDSTSLINSKDGNKIAEIPTVTTTQPTPGISSWGIRTCSDLNTSSCTELYKPLPAKNITNTFLSGTSGIHQHLFQIGISTSPNLPSGTYSTNILVTASQH